MRKVLLASAAIAALAAFSAPAFAETASAVKDAATVVTERNNVSAPTTTIDHKAIVRGLISEVPVAAHGKSIPFDSNNVAYVDQVGTGNSNSQTQVGFKNLSVVAQGREGEPGSYNEAIVHQTGSGTTDRNVSYVKQTGEKNEVSVTQSGKGNTAVMVQSGKKNGWDGRDGYVSSAQTQTGDYNEAYASAIGGWNFSAQTQIGNGNKSSIDQTSGLAHPEYKYANVARTTQRDGNDNQSIISQSNMGQGNDGNLAVTNQSGDRHFAIQYQSGVGNGIEGHALSSTAADATTGAYISQSGSDHTAGQFQVGDYNLATIDQTGHAFNVAAQFQYGDGNKASVTQTGSYNIGMQAQTGNNHTAILSQSGAGSNVSTQVQGGEKNYASAVQTGSSNRSTQRQN
jgi:hypothetical protein